MSARRGEVPFVAVRVGRSNDPREVLAFAAELRIPRPHALGLLVLWEEMILEVGDALTGRIKGYTAVHIAAKLGWTGKPAKLIAALQATGILKSHRGTFFHPWWRESITGQYANTRAELREHDAERKRRQRALERGEGGAQGEKEIVTSGGRPADTGGRHADLDRNPDINQSRDVRRTPPQPPANAGGGEGASRWEWLLENHQRPTNPRGCVPYLERLTDEEWSLLQWVTLLPPGGGAYKLSRKKRVLGLDTYQILSRAAYLQLRREWQEKLRADQRPKESGPVKLAPARDEAADNAARAAAAAAFVLAQLADPDLSEPAKEKAKSRFRTNHPDAVPPWELS